MIQLFPYCIIPIQKKIKENTKNTEKMVAVEKMEQVKSSMILSLREIIRTELAEHREKTQMNKLHLENKLPHIIIRFLDEVGTSRKVDGDIGNSKANK